jgi:hypothetical protein
MYIEAKLKSLAQGNWFDYAATLSLSLTLDMSFLGGINANRPRRK